MIHHFQFKNKRKALHHLSLYCKVYSRNSGECPYTCSTPVGSTPSSVEACGYVERQHHGVGEKLICLRTILRDLPVSACEG